MSPSLKKRGKKTHTSVQAPPVLEPTIERSVVVNEEAMKKVRPMLTSDFNEWKATVAWPASRAVIYIFIWFA